MNVAFLFKLSGRILWRSWRATIVLSFMIISAVAALVFLTALAIGTNDAMIRNSTGLYSGHIAGDGITATDTPRLVVPGVRQVLQRHQVPVLLQTDTGAASVALIGVHPEQEKQTAAYWKKTIRGTFLTEGDETIFLSEAVLQQLHADLGDTVRLIDPQGRPLKRLKIVGIYKTGMTTLDHGVAFCPVQALPPSDAPLSVAVFLEDGASPETIADQYRLSLPAARFATWSEFMPDLKQLIDLSNVCMAILIIVVFAIVAVGIACTFLIFTLKNLREHGILKAMGFTSGETTLLLLIQIGWLTIAAAALGALTGALCVWLFANVGIDISVYISHNQYFTVSGMIYPRLTPFALFAPPLVAVLFGLIAAVWPIASVLRQNPTDILRSV